MNKFIDVLLYVWQLPQNLLGLILLIYYRNTVLIEELNGVEYYIAPKIGGGISLGKYIIISPRYKNDYFTKSHEYGHSVQSKYLGWLYLIVIGLPSIVHCGIHSLFRGWGIRWDYYSFYTESSANELGFRVNN